MSKRRKWSEMDKSAIPLTKLRKAFEVYNQTTGKSPSTYRWYSDKLSLFERFLGDGCQLSDLTVESAREFIAHLQGRRVRHEHNPFVTNKEGALSSSYIQGFARALRAFSTWLNAEGYTDTNVLKPLKPPRIQQKVVQVLTEKEIGGVLAHFDQDDPFGFRNYAIVWTMLDCGLRASELCNLRIEDAHIEEGYLKVLGKGNKERLMPVGGRTQTILARWRDCFRDQFVDDESPYLFLGSSGHPLTPSSIETMMKRAGQAAGVPRLHAHFVAPHLRHQLPGQGSRRPSAAPADSGSHLPGDGPSLRGDGECPTEPTREAGLPHGSFRSRAGRSAPRQEDTVETKAESETSPLGSGPARRCCLHNPVIDSAWWRNPETGCKAKQPDGPVSPKEVEYG